MKTSSILLLFVIISSSLIITTHSPATMAFADHATAEVQLGIGSGVPGCEETNECYIPYEVTVDVGGEVTWINDDAGHTVTAGDLQADASAVGVDYTNGFDSGFFLAGATFSNTFDTAGTYPYFCQVHPWMTGIVVVEHDDDDDSHDDNDDKMMMDDDKMMMDDDKMMMDDDKMMMDDDKMMMDDDKMMMDDDKMMMDDDKMMMDDDKMMMDDDDDDNGKNNGCLIATAAYGSELAPQVQLLREIRDNTLYSTESGSSFMAGFNQFYYSFSPAIADLERQSPAFKEVIKTAITPMISSLSIMTLADQGSEYEVLGYGISVIALNLGMYVAAPIGAIVFTVRRYF